MSCVRTNFSMSSTVAVLPRRLSRVEMLAERKARYLVMLSMSVRSSVIANDWAKMGVGALVGIASQNREEVSLLVQHSCDFGRVVGDPEEERVWVEQEAAKPRKIVVLAPWGRMAANALRLR